MSATFVTSVLFLQVARICPFITVLNVVTEDPMLESFVEMTNVKKAQIELEDCFGLGLHSYLRKMGGKLEELVISCSSGEEETQNFFCSICFILIS